MMKARFFSLFFLFPAILFSQWQATKGPYGGNVQAFYEFNNVLYAGTSAGLFITTDNGENWKFIDVGFSVNVTAIAEMNGRMFIGTFEKGIVCSTDNGLSWQLNNIGLSTNPAFCGYCIQGFSVAGNEIFAATKHGLYKSKINDTSWTFVTDGYFDTFSGKNSLMIWSEKSPYGPGCSSRITTDAGISFRSVTFPVTPADCSNFSYSFDVSSHCIFAVTDYNLYFSIDSGYTWTSIYHDSADYKPTMVKVVDNKIYLATLGKGLLVSSVNTASWSNTGLPPFTINTICKSNDELFVGTGYYRGAYTSSTGNYNWTEKNKGLSAVKVLSIESHNNFIVAGGQGGIIVSTDTGSTWKKVDLRLPGKILDKDNDFFIEELATNGKIIVAGSGDVYKNVFISLDSGSTWTIINQPIQDIIAGVALIGNRLIVCTWFNFYYSDDNGKTWNTGQLPGNSLIWDIDYDSNDLYIISSSSIYISHNGGSSWDSIPGPKTSIYNSLKIGDSMIFVVDGLDGLYSGPKNWSAWFQSYANDPNKYATNYKWGVTNKDVFISDNRTLPGFMHSPDSGKTWSQENIFVNHEVEQLGSSTHFVYASTPGFGIWRYGSHDLILKNREFNPTSNVQVFPNPTSGIFTLQLDTLFNNKIFVYDLSGKCIYSNLPIKISNQSLDLSDKPKGIYFIEIVADKQKTVKKIILN